MILHVLTGNFGIIKNMAVITLKDKCADAIRVEAVLQTAYKVE